MVSYKVDYLLLHHLFNQYNMMASFRFFRSSRTLKRVSGEVSAKNTIVFVEIFRFRTPGGVCSPLYKTYDR